MKYFTPILFLLFSYNVSAQEKHFIFIQSDSNQPFYVSMNGKIYSSSASGYLIVPKLTDGEYDFAVGFAKNEYPEQNFHTVIDKKDVGFNLKNLAEQGWGLFNLQTLTLTMAGDKPAKTIAQTAGTLTDEPISFKKKPVDTVKPAIATTIEASPVSKPAQVAKDSVIATAPVAVTTPAISLSENKAIDSPAPTPANDSNSITKLSENNNTNGVNISFLDIENADTIRLTIPNAPAPVAATVDNQPKIAAATTNNVPATPIQPTVAPVTTPATDPKFLDINVTGSQQAAEFYYSNKYCC